MKSKTDHQAATNEEGKIRVTGKKKRFSLFQKQEEPAVDVDAYPEESLKGRNPVELANKSQPRPRAATPPQTSRSANRPSGKANRRATWASPSSPLSGRNPVDFDKAGEYEKNKDASSPTSPLKGRNPVDFDGCDPYGGKKPGSLDGRNPRDFDGCDPYGNPVRPQRRRSALDGRNPKDFDGCDPYGNSNRPQRRRSALEGRNPKDFDGCNPYSNPIRPQRRRSALEGRNPIDFDGPRDPYGNSLAGRNPKDFEKARNYEDGAGNLRGDAMPYGTEHIHPRARSTKPDPPEVCTVYTVESAEDDGRFGAQDTWQEDESSPTPTQVRRSAMEPTTTNTAPRVDNANADRIVQEKKVESTASESSPVKQKRRSTVKKPPRGTREKFSLKTYHLPRNGVSAT